MKKLGGVTLMTIGAILILFAILRTLNVFMVFLSEEQTSYGVGFITGTVLVVILLIVLGLKVIKKGKSLFIGTSNTETFTGE